MPPKDEAGASSCGRRSATWSRYQPTFVSVTYGAGGTTRDTTVAHHRPDRRARRRCAPMGHLTCVGHTREELERDPRLLRRRPASATCWRCAATRRRARARRGRRRPGGLTYASELVELAREHGRLQHRRRGLPRGPPVGASLDGRRRAGAGGQGRGRARSSRSPSCSSAPPDYFALVERVRALGCDIPILPGHHADHEPRQVAPDGRAVRRRRARRGASARFDGLDRDPADVRARWASQIATELCQRAARGRRARACTSTRSTGRGRRCEIFEALRITSDAAARVRSRRMRTVTVTGQGTPAGRPDTAVVRVAAGHRPPAWRRPWRAPTRRPTRSSRSARGSPTPRGSPRPTLNVWPAYDNEGEPAASRPGTPRGIALHRPRQAAGALLAALAAEVGDRLQVEGVWRSRSPTRAARWSRPVRRRTPTRVGRASTSPGSPAPGSGEVQALAEGGACRSPVADMARRREAKASPSSFEPGETPSVAYGDLSAGRARGATSGWAGPITWATSAADRPTYGSPAPGVACAPAA